MTQRGFVIFPGFRFPDAARKEDAAKKKLEEEKKEEKDLIFYEPTTFADVKQPEKRSYFAFRKLESGLGLTPGTCL